MPKPSVTFSLRGVSGKAARFAAVLAIRCLVIDAIIGALHLAGL